MLSVIGVGETVEEARSEAYKNIEGVEFQGKYFRSNIGLV